MKRREAQTLGDILRRYIDDNQVLKEKIMENRVIHAWTNILVNGVAAATRKISLRNGVLHIQLNSSVIRNELLLSKQKIITHLNQEVRENIIQDLIIR